MKTSPFAPEHLPNLPDIAGVRMASCEAGIRYQDRKDLTLFELAEGTQVAGVLTRSKTASAPVDWCREALGGKRARALIVNSGNANAFTGVRGRQAVEMTTHNVCEALGCTPGEVFVASTGVIGEPLDASAFGARVRELSENLMPDAWTDAAKAIMTTDTYPKLSTRGFEMDGIPVRLNGIAKGAGMIAPDMATMLCFIFTDAPVSADILQSLLAPAVDRSFNSITIDGDTSTSDTVLLFATGRAGAEAEKPMHLEDPTDPRIEALREALGDITRDLAQQIVKDGEGISKFVTIRVCGAETENAARKIALSIGNSPLVKTAIAGEDPNWGRVVMAVGKAGERADRDALSIWFGDQLVAERGEVSGDYSEDRAARYMKNGEIELKVDVGVGEAGATIWTCDLTHEYISINADYRS